jgi:hypothetical protein
MSTSISGSTWYKILNDGWRHNGFQYQLGLNVDTVPFNPSGSCQSGGLYYTNAEFLPLFLDYGFYIAEIEIPEDAQTYKDPDGNKWKADRLIIRCIYKIKYFHLFKDPAWCLEAVQKNSRVFQYIKYHTDDLCLAAVRKNGRALKYINNQTDEICLTAVSQNFYAVKYLFHQTKELCLYAVKRDGYMLRYIKKQTDEICLAAVKQYGLALKYVKEQTDEICLAAVRQNGRSLRYVKNQTDEICSAAVQQNKSSSEFVKDQTEEFYAKISYHMALKK